MWKHFTAQGHTQYLDILPEILKHRSIGMTPTEASRGENRVLVYFRLYGDLTTAKERPKFRIVDRVRISKYKRETFDKGYTLNWTEEIFMVDQIQRTDPVTYRLKDLNGEPIRGNTSRYSHTN